MVRALSVGSDRVDAAWARIAAVKQPGPARVTAPKAFVYDETEPLQLAETMPKTDERT